MLSNHNPLAFATQYNWVIASLVFLMGVTIRHYFNSKHARKGNPTWTWAATSHFVHFAIMWLSTNPKLPGIEAEAATLSATEQKFVSAKGFEVRDAVHGALLHVSCGRTGLGRHHHRAEGVMLDTDQKIAAHAYEIYLQAALSHAMPPANITEISPEERRAIADWYQAAVSGS